MTTRVGQAWVNDDQPTSWSVVLIVASVTRPRWVEHRFVVLDAGRQSGYRPGELDTWREYPHARSWDHGVGYLRRIA